MECRHEVIKRVEKEDGWAHCCEHCGQHFTELGGREDRDAAWITALVHVIQPQFMRIEKKEGLSLEEIVSMFVGADRAQRTAMVQ